MTAEIQLEITAWTEVITKLMEAGEIPGLSIAVIRNGEIFWNGLFGDKNAIKDGKTDSPVHEDTLFPAASLSKPVFAYIVLRLMDRGVIDLDKPLHEYLQYPRLENDERYKKITARMCLSHNSGLPNWGGTPLSILVNPGESFSYSGEGFMYLQAVAEKLTGQSLEQLAQQEVFKPLGMTHSTYVWSPSLNDILVTGYNGAETVQRVDDPAAFSASSLLTTAHDYARFVIAMMEGRGLLKDSAQMMLTAQIQAPKKDIDSGIAWGLGFGLEESDAGEYFWHWGDNGGFKCFVIASQPKREGMVYFTNTQYGLSIAAALTAAIIGGNHPSIKWIGYDQFDSPKVAARKELYHVYLEQGADAGLAYYFEMRNKFPEIVNEDFTNSFGFYLQGHKMPDAATAIWEENARNYPQSINPYSTLGWNYIYADKVELALENMEKAYALDTTDTQRLQHITWLREYLQIKQQPAEVPGELLRKYAGKFKKRVITFDQAVLYCEITETGKIYPLIPFSENTFAIDGMVWERLIFNVGESTHQDTLTLSFIEDRKEELNRDA